MWRVATQPSLPVLSHHIFGRDAVESLARRGTAAKARVLTPEEVERKRRARLWRRP